MAKRMSQAELAEIVDRDLAGQYRVVQGTPDMDSKAKPRRTAAVKTRVTKKTARPRKAAATSKRKSSAAAAPDEIVFLESASDSATDTKPLRKAAVISGVTRRVIGLQG